MLENPPNPLFKGELMLYTLYMFGLRILQPVNNHGFAPPLKRGLGGFSELTFEVDKLFNHES